MKTLIVSLLLVTVQVTCAENVDGDVQIAGANDKCAEYCTKTFQAQDVSLKSCQQGCRLYSVLQFVDKSGDRDGQSAEPNATAISTSCQEECNEAYKDSILKGACVQGCQHQSPFTTGHLKIVMDDSMPMFSFAKKMMSDAFGKVDELQSCMLDKFDRMRDWFKNDPLAKLDNGLQDTAVMNMFNRMDSQFKNMLKQFSNSDMDARRQLVGGKEDVASGNVGSTVNPLYAYAKSIARNGEKEASVKGSQSATGGAKSGQADETGEPLLVIKIVSSNGLYDGDDRRMMGPMMLDRPMGMMGPMMDKNVWSTFTHQSLDEKPHDPSPPLLVNEKTYFGPAGTSVDSDDTWLACFARRTQNLPMLTRWLLCVALMLSILCMIYLCLAVMRASQQRRRQMYLQYKMGKSDAVYLMPPPTYEKTIPGPGYLLEENEKQRESPPPAYEVAAAPFPIPTTEPVIKLV